MTPAEARVGARLTFPPQGRDSWFTDGCPPALSGWAEFVLLSYLQLLPDEAQP